MSILRIGLLPSTRSVSREEGKVLQEGQGQGRWAVLLHIYVGLSTVCLSLFSSACLSHSVQLEFGISVQPDVATPLSLQAPSQLPLLFMSLRVFHMK